MFSGFRKEAFDFLAGIQLNNNEQYYQENLEIYRKYIKEPMAELCDELAPVISMIDPRLDTRPSSAVSRLRRDTRFTKNKEPFRDHVWMGWRYPGERRSEGFHMYWGFGVDWIGWGCGSYAPDRQLMDAFRRYLRGNPEEVRRILLSPEVKRKYQIYGEPFKKMKVPEDVPADLQDLYRMKYLGLENVPDRRAWEQIQSHAIVDRLTEELRIMMPLVQLMKQLREGESTVETVQETVKAVLPSEEKKLHVRSAEEFEF